MEGNSLVIRPYTEQHAIKTMAFVVELDKDISQDSFQKLSVLEKKLKGELPRLVSHRAVTLKIGGEVNSPSNVHAGEGPGGFTLDRLMADGTQEWAMTIQQNFVRVLCNSYKRWDGTWSKARSYFNEALPIVLEESYVKAVTLQYVDEFISDGEVSEFDTKELFREQSPYLTPFVFEAKDLWHSHSGKFSFTHDGRRVLDVVNVGLLSLEEGFKAQIIMTHKLDLANGGAIFTEDDNVIQGIESVMSLLHAKDKEILSQVITDKYIDRIGLVVEG